MSEHERGRAEMRAEIIAALRERATEWVLAGSLAKATELTKAADFVERRFPNAR